MEVANTSGFHPEEYRFEPGTECCAAPLMVVMQGEIRLSTDSNLGTPREKVALDWEQISSCPYRIMVVPQILDLSAPGQYRLGVLNTWQQIDREVTLPGRVIEEYFRRVGHLRYQYPYIPMWCNQASTDGR